MKDLVILAADQDFEFTLRGLLSRHRSFGLRPITFDVFIEPEHDPACLLRGVEFLEKLHSGYRHALLIFDHEGCGREMTNSGVLTQELSDRFARGPWADQARALILEPELESWVWSDSPHVERVTGWNDRPPGLRPWLRVRGFLDGDSAKPGRPKEAFEAALRESRIPLSASIFHQLASAVGIDRCIDPAFMEFRKILQGWFAVEGK